MNEAVLLGVAFVLGAAIAFALERARRQRQTRELESQLSHSESEQKALRERLGERETQNQKLEEKLEQSRQEILEAERQMASLRSDNAHLQEQAQQSKEQAEKQNEELLLRFKNLSGQILEKHSENFSRQNKVQIGEVLSPLREKISEFQKKVEESQQGDIKRSATLNEQLRQLMELNQQITTEAHNLSQALRGESKTQGNWGEMQLESILQKAGLQKNVHYRKENSFRDSEEAHQRPDFIIDLPDGKNLILDSKVSLTAYTRFFETDEPREKDKFLKQHLQSLYGHMKMLSTKNYPDIYQINPPDYVMLFLANEPALALALQEDSKIYEKALEKNLVLVGPSTLIATMRTISYIWRQDAQNRNAEEIARKAGALYDKFANLAQDMSKLGNNLNTAENTYQDAMRKLAEGKGNLIKRAEDLRNMGANAHKEIPENLRKRSEE